MMMIGFAILLLGLLYLYRDVQALKKPVAVPVVVEEKVPEKSVPTKVE